jgi:hypothetical protein
VFKKSHDLYSEMQRATALIVGRYQFLLATINYMLHELGEPWALTWRYICSIATSHFEQFGLHDEMEQDKKILRLALKTGDKDRAFASLAVEIFNAMLYNKAKEHYQASVKTPTRVVPPGDGLGRGRPQGQPGAGGAGPGGDPSTRPCALCASTTHAYFAGHYDHPAATAITQQCPKIKNSIRCTFLHAFAGPLRSPCSFDHQA